MFEGLQRRLESLEELVWLLRQGAKALFYQTMQSSGNPLPQQPALNIDSFFNTAGTIPCGQFDFGDDPANARSTARFLTLYRCSDHAGDTTYQVVGQESLRFNTGTTWNVTLPPTADIWDGIRVRIKDSSGGAAVHNITITANAGQQVESIAALGTYGASTAITTNGGGVELEWDDSAAKWQVV